MPVTETQGLDSRFYNIGGARSVGSNKRLKKAIDLGLRFWFSGSLVEGGWI
jgi:hypothetical protein